MSEVQDVGETTYEVRSGPASYQMWFHRPPSRFKCMVAIWTEDLRGILVGHFTSEPSLVLLSGGDHFLCAISPKFKEFCLEVPGGEPIAPLHWPRFEFSRPVPGVTPSVTYHTPICN